MRGVIEQLTQTTGISGKNISYGKPQKLDLRLFPNPTNSQSVITYTVAVNSPVAIRLFDARGREVLNEIFTGNDAGEVVQYNLDLSGYSSGIYFVR
ncbi:MAG: T9SS type A sorting domain-containing protein, partial [Calditrichia bacterium]